MTANPFDETPVGVCTRDPERWTTTADDEAKALCRSCPRRWLCARDACELLRDELSTASGTMIENSWHNDEDCGLGVGGSMDV